MNELVSIGRFSTMTRLSIKALRHYDEIGLLQPAKVDPQSGYRYYRLSQANTAEAIRTLRSIDMPLDEILVVLESEEPEVIQKHLDVHRERLEARLADQQRMLTYLRRLIEKKEFIMPYTVTVKEVPAINVASLRIHTDLASIATDLAGGFGQVGAAVAGPPAGPPFVIFHDVIDEETDGDIEICFPVPGPIEASGDVTSRELAGGSMVTTIHKGPYDQVSPAYHTLTGWVQEHGHQFAGPPREIYLNDPTTVEPDEILTEIQWPIS